MTPASDTLLELRQVTTYYGQMRVLHQVDMVIHIGEMVCLLGGNASGKSTTLKTILGIVRPAQGEIFFRGERVDHLGTAERIARGMAVAMSAAQALWRTLFEPFVKYLFALVVMMGLACAAFGSALSRIAFGRTSHP